jgi:hypothetical protein
MAHSSLRLGVSAVKKNGISTIAQEGLNQRDAEHAESFASYRRSKLDCFFSEMS